MAQRTPTNDTAFSILPIELNQAIACELETDKDIITYKAVCRATRDAIEADKGHFWRAQFRKTFDLVEGKTNRELRKLYQTRKKQLRRGTGYDFFWGHKVREQDVVEVLRQLIVESFKGPNEFDEHGQPRSLNHNVLANFVLNSKMLLNTRRATRPPRNEPQGINSALAAVKLVCSHFLFELEGAKHNVFALEESQRVVYMSTNAAPLYEGPDMTMVNMEWMLHCLNFFRHHMMNEEAMTLHKVISELSPRQKPSSWQEPLRKGSYALGKHWKGTYSFLDTTEVAKLRRMTPDQVSDAFLCDKNIDEGKVQSLQLDFVEGEPLRWPKIFENRLHSLRNKATPQLKTQGRSKSKYSDSGPENLQFTGAGIDLDDDFNAIGWLNPLPAQHGIPGWQRITFMKHFMDDFDQLEQDNLWAYEGVVLPGGRIILGRWWYASDEVDFNNDYNGPFILWAVDEPDILEESDEEEGDESDEA